MSISVDDAIRLLEESPLNLLTMPELQEFITEYPTVGAKVLSGFSEDKLYGMCKLVAASIYSFLMVAGDTEISEIDEGLLIRISAVAIRATAGLLTLEEIR